jgi:hypothetical protein
LQDKDLRRGQGGASGPLPFASPVNDPADLAKVLPGWDDLPPHIRAALQILVAGGSPKA